jgi:CheY-like chemotaxis protein
MLRRCGADVCAADSVLAAREMLSVRTPHVIVTDIAMPGYDGFALLEHVRSRADAIPVIALTASAPTDEVSEFAAWVRKPIDPFEFAHVIATLQQRA